MRKRVVSAILSALLPGAGQFYSHHWIKGGFFLAAALLFSGMVRRVSMGASASLGQSIFLGNSLFIHLILLGLAVWSAVDGFRAPAKGKK
jgi:hypothetical protein